MTYYRVLPHDVWFKVQIWRWWWPFWVDGVDWLRSEDDAARWIKGHSTFYDGAE